MLLTLPWFAAMYSGRVNINDDGRLRYKKPIDADDTWDKLEPPGNISPFGTGVGFNTDVRYSAKFMIATMVSYLIIQLPAFRSMQMAESISSPAQRHRMEISSESVWALVGFCMCC